MEIIYVRKGPLTVEIDGQKFTGKTARCLLQVRECCI
ncbi:MAG: hypothetical protein ACLVH0_08435 [Coprococcus eutactus]